MPFPSAEQRPDFAALEARVLKRWRERGVFRRSLRNTEGAPLFRFYEGPPTANGRPGVHHVVARVFKDVFPRYRTMKGEHVPRRAGWDCHGIPVELEVERELGFTGKGDIERYGVEAFNARCRESVTRYVEEFRQLTERIGFWVDTEDAYWTMSPEYVDSVWWSLKTLFDRGLIYADHRVVPYCPRCGTALSDHEVAQGYRQVEDQSVYVRLPLLTGPLAGQADLLVWTTMPWTFVATTAAVINASIRYVLARGGRAGERPVVLAADRVAAALGDGALVLREVAVGELVGTRYRGPFDLVGPGSPADPEGDPAAWRIVVADDFVTTDQGSGIVSTGAAFGADDMRVARDNGLPVVNPVRPDGRFDHDTGPYAGMDVRAADPAIVSDLDKSGLLVYAHSYPHTYPFCWRCQTPLIYYAKPSWFLATTQFQEQLMADNSTVDWRPSHVRTGRYGDWLANNVDWALSRERYWGTPLPFWKCADCDHVLAVGSRHELGELTDADLSTMDPHRPHVDLITVECPRCSGSMHRVPEVLDAWYDSGAMSFAQHGYPHLPGSADRLAAMLPADYVCEGIDQTRGWFYSLQAVATSIFGFNAYRRALCLGHIVDEDGHKMSKSAGNVVDPWQLLDTYGADALRWLLLAEGNPWQSRRVGDAPLREVTSRLLLTVWNTYYFFVSYANLAGWSLASSPPAKRPVLDRYILAELADVTAAVDAALADFDPTGAGRHLSSFVDRLSNWYVRLSRHRFKVDRSADPADAASAFATLYTCLTTLAGLLAPFIPFLADELHENLVRSVDEQAADSVHLTAFPVPDAEALDPELVRAMALAQRVVTLGRNARKAAGIAVRQPLPRAVVSMPLADKTLLPLVAEVIAAELNVKRVESAADAGQHVAFELKPNFRALGREHGKRTPDVAAAIIGLEPTAATAALRANGSLQVTVDGGTVVVPADHVEVIEKAHTGWQVSVDGPYGCALDLAIDDRLRAEGLARELVRLVNDLRRRTGVDRADRVIVELAVLDDPAGTLRTMLDTHAGAITRDVFAESLRIADDGAGEPDLTVPMGDGRIAVRLQAMSIARNGDK